MDVLFLFQAAIVASIPLMTFVTLSLSSLLQMEVVPLILTISIGLIFDLSRTLVKSLILPVDERRRRNPNPQLREQPLISILIPAHDEEAAIKQAIESVLENEYKRKEIIVIDDGSMDRTYEIAKEYERQGVRVLKRTKSGMKAYAINYGLLFAKGEIVVTVDADTIMGRDALTNIARSFSDSNIIAVSGNLRILNKSRNVLTRLQSYEYVVSFEMGRRLQSMFNTLLILPGALTAIRRDMFSSLGQFDTSWTEDFDATLKLHKVQGRLIFQKEAMAWTTVPERWSDWFEQRVRWSKGQIKTLLKHRNLFFRKRFGAPGTVGAPDMVLMDIISLMVRPVGYVLIALYITPWINIVILLTVLYLYNELIIITTAIIISDIRDDYRNSLLFPAMFIYRIIYAWVRFIGYVLGFIPLRERW